MSNIGIAFLIRFPSFIVLVAFPSHAETQNKYQGQDGTEGRKRGDEGD